MATLTQPIPPPIENQEAEVWQWAFMDHGKGLPIIWFPPDDAEEWDRVAIAFVG
jgi:hypothetical protein